MRILLTGATGFVGKRVVSRLLASGDEVVVLSRYVPKAILSLGSKCKYYQWSDTNSLPPLEAFEGVDAIINLMGEGIAEKRWDSAQKKKIYDSRIVGTRNLLEAVSQLTHKPKTFVSASAVGIYGNRGDEEIVEDSSTVDDFLGKVCLDWEAEAKKAEGLGLRLAIIRTGVVLGKGGGALAKMLPIFKLGMGGPVGSGKQYMSWIHVDDLAAMYIEAAKNSSYSGIYNGTAPEPVSSKEFAKVLGHAIHRPAFAPAPSFALKLVFGEMSQVLLDGQKVIPKRALENRFSFRYPKLEAAFKEIL